MERTYMMTEEALTLVVLESAYRFLDVGGHLLTESIDEADLASVKNAVQKAIQAFRYNPEEFDRMMNQAAKNGAMHVVNAVRRVLARHGVTTKWEDPETGRPVLQRTGKYNARMDRIEIRKRVLELAPQLADGFPSGSSEDAFFKPVEQNGSGAFSCRAVGNLTELLKSMDGQGLSVVETGRQSYGSDDDSLVETELLVTLPKRQSA